GHGRGDVGDVPDLGREVVGHRVDGVREVLPGAGDAGHDGLTAEPSFGADLAGDARDLRGEAAELVFLRVDRFLQLQDLAADVACAPLRSFALGHGRRDLGDVADLGREVAGHQVHVLGQVLPDPADLAHFRLAAELAVGADLARHAR